jgi:pimeloyl-ACP methyl ester carboxylesterase
MMATFVLIHGAADSAWYWHLVEPELRQRGHDVVTMDLPCEDDGAGPVEYAEVVVEAIGDRRDLVVVAQSFGGYTAPLVCERVPVDLLVLLAAMVPSPGEPASDYWVNTGWEPPKVDGDQQQPEGMSREDADTIATFYHDVPLDLAVEALQRTRSESEARGGEPWPLERWPDVPTRFLLCRHDRMFGADWLRGVVKDRLGFVPDEIDGSHCVALSRPQELTDRLVAYLHPDS